MENIMSNAKSVSNIDKQCNTKALSTFIPEIPYKSSLKGFKSSGIMTEICPNLDSTCCNENELFGLVEQLKNSFQFLQYRMEIMFKMFRQVGNIKNEKFKDFIAELTDDDIQCYDEIQNTNLDKKKLNFQNNPEMQKLMEKKRHEIQFDARKIYKSFSIFKTQAPFFISKIRLTNKKRENFFSGVICSMCSPTFSDQIKIKDGTPFLEVNRNMCNQVIRERIDFAESLAIFPFLQNVIDVVYCARKNSKSERDYEGFKWEDFNLLSFDTNFLSDYKKKRYDCVSGEGNYFPGRKVPKECKSYCESGFKFFELPMVSMDNFLRIENEFHNMFVRILNVGLPPLKRLEIKREEYYQERDKLISKGQLVVVNDKNVEKMSFIQTTPDAKVDFKKTQISIAKHSGMNVTNTQMNEIFYMDSYLIRMIFMIFMICLVFK
jgi:hypothetical protein